MELASFNECYSDEIQWGALIIQHLKRIGSLMGGPRMPQVHSNVFLNVLFVRAHRFISGRNITLPKGTMLIGCKGTNDTM